MGVRHSETIEIRCVAQALFVAAVTPSALTKNGGPISALGVMSNRVDSGEARSAGVSFSDGLQFSCAYEVHT